jgi:hypothetical protein
VDECRLVMQKFKRTCLSVYWEVNGCADILATNGMFGTYKSEI